MIEKRFHTDLGDIHYWTGGPPEEGPELVFLPGLTADHRLFDMQVRAFEEKYRLLVWDPPAHGASRPFDLSFSLDDLARYLQAILHREGMTRPVLIGQSMGGYVSQCFIQLFPGEAAGFISIDSAPLKRRYITGVELWMLHHTGPLYRAYPWRRLLKSGSTGVADTAYGQALMLAMMETYEKGEYCRLAAHGFDILADAFETGRPYTIDCPCLLICGEHDRAGSAKRYNVDWAREEQLPIRWIKDAGHNANTDAPETVNGLIGDFLLQKNK